MDNGLVSRALSGLLDLEEYYGGTDEVRTSTSKKKTYTLKELCNEVAPFYLSIGMTANMFWNEDVDYAVQYRKAWKIQQDRLNQQLWLQGLYIHDALISTPIVVSGFKKSGDKQSHTYPTEPYVLNKIEAERREEDKKIKEQLEIKNKMIAFASQFNKKMRQKEAEAIE